MRIIIKDIENKSTEPNKKNTISLIWVVDTMVKANIDNKTNTKASKVQTTYQEDRTLT